MRIGSASVLGAALLAVTFGGGCSNGGDPHLKALQGDPLNEYRPAGLERVESYSTAEKGGSAFSKPQQTSLIRALHFADDPARERAWTDVLRFAKEHGWTVFDVAWVSGRWQELSRDCGDVECTVSVSAGAEPSELILHFRTELGAGLRNWSAQVRAMRGDRIVARPLPGGQVIEQLRLEPADATRMSDELAPLVVGQLVAFRTVRARDLALTQARIAAADAGWQGGNRLVQTSGDVSWKYDRTARAWSGSLIYSYNTERPLEVLVEISIK